MLQKIVAFISFALLVMCCPIQATTCKVNGSSTWYPVFYWQNDKASGLAAELLAAFESEHAVRFIFEDPMPWSRVEYQLKQGQLDMVAGAYFNQKRNSQFIYSVAFHTEDVNIFVAKQTPFAYRELSDLIGLTGIRPASGSYGEKFDKYALAHLDIQQNTDMQSAVNMLLAKRVDYLVLAKAHGQHLLKTMQVTDKVRMLKNPVARNDVYFVLNKQTVCLQLLPKLNRFITQRRQKAEAISLSP